MALSHFCGLDRGATRLDIIVKADGVTAATTVDGVRAKLETPAPEATLAAIAVTDSSISMCRQASRQTSDNRSLLASARLRDIGRPCIERVENTIR
ncbi:MAG: hypothetical protein EBR88_03735 [Betaproteobacteria bacterium]|nr:hypothetical protein [Betaproteobacteria bacterium]